MAARTIAPRRFNVSIFDARNIVYLPKPRARVARSRKYMKNSRSHKHRNLYATPRDTSTLYSRIGNNCMARARLSYGKSSLIKADLTGRDYRSKWRARQLPETASRVFRKRITKMLPLRRGRLIKRNKNVSPVAVIRNLNGVLPTAFPPPAATSSPSRPVCIG